MATLAMHLRDFEVVVRENSPRAEVLERIIAQLETFPADDDRGAFVRIFKDAKAVLELGDLELANALRISRPTVGRWERGESAPHPLARRPVFLTLARIARGKLRAHQSI